MAQQLGVAEEGGRAVVVGVQEGEGFFLEEEEDGVEEFEVFGEVVQLLFVSYRAFVCARKARLT